jgi:shikimate dehydrogenase
MEPEAGVSPVGASLLGNYKVVMDIVYAPLETKLLADGAAAGCLCNDDLEMLLYQRVS